MINELFDYFKDMLQRTRAIDRDPRSRPQEEHEKDADDQNLHGEEVRDGRGRIIGKKVLALLAGLNRMCSERLQNARSDSAKVLVQEMGEEQLFWHSAIKLRVRSVASTPGSVQLISGLNHDADCGDSEPNQEAVRTHRGTLEYSIASDSDNAVAQQES